MSINGGLIRDIELEGASARSDVPRGRLPAFEVARPDEHGEAVRPEILGDLKTDPFVLAPVTRATGLSCIANLLLHY